MENEDARPGKATLLEAAFQKVEAATQILARGEKTCRRLAHIQRDLLEAATTGTDASARDRASEVAELSDEARLEVQQAAKLLYSRASNLAAEAGEPQLAELCAAFAQGEAPSSLGDLKRRLARLMAAREARRTEGGEDRAVEVSATDGAEAQALATKSERETRLDPIQQAVEMDRQRLASLAETRRRAHETEALERALHGVVSPRACSFGVTLGKWRYEWDGRAYALALGDSKYAADLPRTDELPAAEELLAGLWTALVLILRKTGRAAAWTSIGPGEALEASDVLRNFKRQGVVSGEAVVLVGEETLCEILVGPWEGDELDTGTRRRVVSRFARLRKDAPRVLDHLGRYPVAIRDALERKMHERSASPSPPRERPTDERRASSPPHLPPYLLRVETDLLRVESSAPEEAIKLERAWDWIREHGAADGRKLPSRGTWLRYAREVRRLQ